MTHRNASLTVATMLLIAAPPAWAQGDLSADSPLQHDSPLVELLLSEGGTRGEMAQGLLRAMEVAEFQPPDCVPGEEMFDDVPASSPFCPWIEELARRGITGGCGGGNYCPAAPVNRAQMAIFVLRAIEAAVEEVPEGPPGPQGPPGPPGPQGPAGPPGVSGHQIVTVTQFHNDFFDFEAPCPAGKKVVGGGHNWEGSVTGVWFHQDSPNSAGTGWHVRGKSDFNTDITAIAICAQVN